MVLHDPTCTLAPMMPPAYHVPLPTSASLLYPAYPYPSYPSKTLHPRRPSRPPHAPFAPQVLKPSRTPGPGGGRGRPWRLASLSLRATRAYGRMPNHRVRKLNGHPPWSCHTYQMELGYDNWHDNSMAGGSLQNGTLKLTPTIVWHAAIWPHATLEGSATPRRVLFAPARGYGTGWRRAENQGM